MNKITGRKFDLQNIFDDGAELNIFNDAPFPIKRVFVVSDEKRGAIRGKHAHYKCEQILVCVRGRLRLKVFDGEQEEKIILNRGEAFWHGKLEWLEMEYLNDGMMLSLCSHEYDPDDYINSLEEFKRIVKCRYC